MKTQYLNKRIILILSCITTINIANAEPTSNCDIAKPIDSPLYLATKWYRSSAEMQAAYIQTFKLAEQKVLAKHKTANKNWGVVLDIDETVLDNSEYEKRILLKTTTFSENDLYSFMEQSISTATPGSVDFTCNIQKHGGKIILVTNRNGAYDDKIVQTTLENLKATHICFDNVLFANGKQDDNKTPRFEAVAKGNYHNIIASNSTLPALQILAYLGDNIQDFPNSKQTDYSKLDSEYSKFGETYFILPNPMYGSWLSKPIK